MARYDSRDPKNGQSPPPRRLWWRKQRPGRLQGSMVAVSAAAILSVYAVGYVESGNADTGALAATVDAGTVHASSDTAKAPATTPTRSPSTDRRSAPAAPTRTPTPAAQSGSYADGSYVGVGSSRHGSIQATVVVQNGKIVSADITGCGTRYPCSRIAQLPARVVAAQSAKVNRVSGATDSSVAYMRAVTAALQKAGAAS